MATGIVSYVKLVPSNFPLGVDTTYQAHVILGVIVLVLSTLQVMGGFLTSFKLQNYKSNENYYQQAKGHKLMGILLSLITKAQLLLGVQAVGGSLFGLMWGWIIFVFAVRILITIIYKKKSKNTTDIKFVAKKAFSNEQIEIVNQINNGVSSYIIKSNFPKLKWALYGNYVIDMTNIVHPGGNFIIEETWGREVSRFLNGSYALETTKKTKHRHSSFAYNMLNDMIIGQYDLKQNILMTIDLNQTENYLLDFSITNSEFQSWNLVSVQNISPTMSKFLFNSPKFKVSNFSQGLEWIGRHFEIFSPHYPTHKRLYTTVLCMTDDNIKLRKIMIELYRRIKAGAPPTTSITIDINQHQDNFALFIKKYDFKTGFTRFLFSINPLNDTRTTFYLKGPLGLGLELFKKPKGKHIILGIGSGILPFLDLLNYMLNVALFKVFKEKGLSDDILKPFNPSQEVYENSFDPTF